MSKAKTLVDERSKTHGEYGANAAISEKLKEIMHSTGGYQNATYVQKNAIDMICQKLGRIGAGNVNFEDHWKDIQGYAELVIERL